MRVLSDRGGDISLGDGPFFLNLSCLYYAIFNNERSHNKGTIAL